MKYRRPRWLRRAGSWLADHRRAAIETLDRLIRAPLGTLMTVAAIAIALALPATLLTITKNLEHLAGDWRRGAALSLFLSPDMDEAAGERLAAALRTRIDIGRVQVISRKAGLAEFRQYSGLGGALDQLKENPMPVVLAVYPAADLVDGDDVDALVEGLSALPGVDFAQADARWVRRLKAILSLLRDGTLLLGGMLALGVVLVVGNTIRLEIENRRDEIQVMDLVGATGAFIRRPFLYAGAWYGLLGGMLAWATVATAIALLQAPVSHLAALYDTELTLVGLGPPESLTLLGLAAVLGVIGSRIAVGRHLRRLRPV
ncbi:MAG: permease-like cell division protein FtsX [Thiohalocapsa sp.]|jgi:cell division transport system permease protein|uniref:permease-like cell division protein FtsX n=1 Tax=Thiohalocapsa sp. TaxID=2497641 RepID=UPI0025F93487|nr:permease-like cell division protein FtsX [Thiohalocapsa sp.]MCG6942319.1 permease-like cell division protein FtsX [Thiohalocapsa sp.]